MARPDVVPYIAAWQSEERTGTPLLALPGRGIAFPDEVPGDRDAHGVLWPRTGISPGRGRPVYNRVHARRQRRVMERLLCQVCAGPASRTAEGWLWLLHDDRAVEGRGWPESVGATHPPLCLPCAEIAGRMCPHLSGSFIAIRVADPRPWGVYGACYGPSPTGPYAQVRGAAMVGYHDPSAAWVLASQMVRLLRGCTVVPLERELAAARSVA
ncbi:hypothetical protein GXW83_28775 [Streptacidiphilus sp. PB12-B1b]|uniref:hypothetical protein n=1 Tax=Streptacidiphilus sp. PB12-B1b TaxID=2705012 RepID=UPI0015FC7212|nr:hypothetical protein [Streptacidiphilus sp. PB12-B1b]QMU79110.1 hypothetical protein GXW83_28775 [Streptacidiphilus sp. PB12-B1b]